MSKKLNKEDVPATVAGFYYQALLACNEISALALNSASGDTKVGIERGADVKIIKPSGTSKSVEAKFYGSGFNKNSDAIRHSIYNFYKNSFEDDELYFITNVPIDGNGDLQFDDWSIHDTDVKIKPYLSYLYECLIYESTKREKLNGLPNPCYQEFEKYKKISKQKNNAPKGKYIEEILSNGGDIRKYISFSSGRTAVQEKDFIRKIRFIKPPSEEVLKVKAIVDLKAEIDKNVSDLLNRKAIHGKNAQIIRDYTIDKFFETTVEPTAEDKANYCKWDGFSFISVDDFNRFCDEANEEDIKFLNQNEVNNIVKRITNDEEEFFRFVNNDFNEDEAIKEKLKSHYCEAQRLLLGFINKYDLNWIKKCFSLEGYSEDSMFVYILKFITVYSYLNEFQANTSGFVINNSIANLIFEDGSYCYKHGGEIERYKSFVYHLIKDTYANFANIDFNYPIIINAKLPTKEQPCNKILDLPIPTDIANFNANDLKFYKSLDYRCYECLRIEDNINDTKDNIAKFTNCAKKEE